jgi:hypothetical protein
MVGHAMSILYWKDLGNGVGNYYRLASRDLTCLMCGKSFHWRMETVFTDDPDFHEPSACEECIKAGMERFKQDTP